MSNRRTYIVGLVGYSNERRHMALNSIPERLRSIMGLSLLVFLATYVLVALPHYTSVRVLVGAHGFLHASIVTQVLQGIPPSNPAFSGFRIQTYWAFHVLIGVLVYVTDYGPIIIMSQLNTIVTAAAVVLVAWLSVREYGASPGLFVLTAVIAALGLNLVAPIVYVLKASGFLYWAANLPGVYSIGSFGYSLFSTEHASYTSFLSGIIAPGAKTLSYDYTNLFWNWRVETLLNKGTGISGFPLAVFIFCASLFVLSTARDRSLTQQLGTIGILSIILFYIHPPTAFFAYPVIILQTGINAYDIDKERQWVATWTAVAVATLPYFLYLRSIPTTDPGIGFTPSVRNLITVVITLLPLWIGWTAVASKKLRTIDRSKMYLFFGPVLISIQYVVFALPHGNQYKAAYLLGILLAPTAARYLRSQIVAHRDSAVAVVLVVLTIVLLASNAALYYHDQTPAVLESNHNYEIRDGTVVLIDAEGLDPEFVADVSSIPQGASLLVHPSIMDALQPGSSYEAPMSVPALTSRSYYVPPNKTITGEHTIYINYPPLEGRAAVRDKLMSCSGPVDDVPEDMYVVLPEDAGWPGCSVVKRYKSAREWTRVADGRGYVIFTNAE